MSDSTQAPVYSAKCVFCPTWLPMNTEAEIEDAHAHTRACAKVGNGGEVVQRTTTVKLPSKWTVKS